MAEAEPGPGGASRFAAGLIMAAGTRFQAERGIADDADALFHEYMSFNQWNVEPGVARALTDNAGPTVDWLADHGLGYSDIFFSGDDRVPRGHVVKGGGQGIVDCALGALRAYPRVDFAYGRRACLLLTGGGAVSGLAAGDDKVYGRLRGARDRGIRSQPVPLAAGPARGRWLPKWSFTSARRVRGVTPSSWPPRLARRSPATIGD